MRLHRKYRAHTMLPLGHFIDNLHIARTVTAHGDVVECGTWKGGMIAALGEVTRRRAILFDSFEGLPKAKAVDGDAAAAWQSDVDGPWYYDNCTADERDARCAMEAAGVEYQIRKGWFDEAIPIYAAEEPIIGVLHLDGDWYDSVLTCLEHLFPLMSTGGVVLIDDYGKWDGCTRALHDYLARTKATEDVRRLRSGGTFLRKR